MAKRYDKRGTHFVANVTLSKRRSEKGDPRLPDINFKFALKVADSTGTQSASTYGRATADLHGLGETKKARPVLKLYVV